MVRWNMRKMTPKMVEIQPIKERLFLKKFKNVMCFVGSPSSKYFGVSLILLTLFGTTINCNMNAIAINPAMMKNVFANPT